MRRGAVKHGRNAMPAGMKAAAVRCQQRWRSAAALPPLLLLLLQRPPPTCGVTCAVTVCSDDGSPLTGASAVRCAVPNAASDWTEQRDCDAFGGGFDRCQRVHVRDPRGQVVSGIPAVGAYFYRCAKAAEAASYHCGAVDSRGEAADDYSTGDGYLDGNVRFWCCGTDGCNDPAGDTGLQLAQGVVGWTYQQQASSAVWSQQSHCPAQVVAMSSSPLYQLPPQQMGQCLTATGDKQAWAGAQTQQYAEWQSMCVACDMGGGNLGQPTASHYYYSDTSCTAFSVSKISHYLHSEQCDWDAGRQRGFVSSCDTASTCPSPALDGLTIYMHADNTCGLSGRSYHAALPSAEVIASDSGTCLARGSVAASQQRLFETLPGDAMGVRACCQQGGAFLYYYSDTDCENFGLPPVAPSTSPRRGLRFSLNAGSSCEAKAMTPAETEIWVSAECTSAVGASCPPLDDADPPAITCPDLSAQDISVDFVARLRRTNMVADFIAGTRLPDQTEQRELTTGTTNGGGLPGLLATATATDDQDFIFQSLSSSAILSIESLALLGPRQPGHASRALIGPATGTNESWTGSTEFPVGTSTVFFEAEDMRGHVGGATATGRKSTCSVNLALLDICAEFSSGGGYCGVNGECQPETGVCSCNIDLGVQKTVCGGGEVCDGAGDGPCDCDPCPGCTDGSSTWTGVRCDVHPVGNVAKAEKQSIVWVFIVVVVLVVVGSAATFVFLRRAKAKKAREEVVQTASFNEKKKKVYADVPSFKLTGDFGKRPVSFLTMAMKEEEISLKSKDDQERRERKARKGTVVVRADTEEPGEKKKKKKKINPSGSGGGAKVAPL